MLGTYGLLRSGASRELRGEVFQEEGEARILAGRLRTAVSSGGMRCGRDEEER